MDRTNTQPSTEDLYRQRFAEYVERGDDEQNAEMRIIEEGCPVELAEQISDEFVEDEFKE